MSLTILVLFVLCFSVATLGNVNIPQWDLHLVQKQMKRDTTSLKSRDDPLVASLDLDALALSLTVNATLGTPPQELQFLIELDQADTNVLSRAICGTGGACPYGSFDNTSSTSYQGLDTSYNGYYGDGTVSSGTYATDTLTIAGRSVDALQFGYSTGFNTSNSENILGLGYPALESPPNAYANFPSRLKADGNISINAYSMWFDGDDFKAGKLVFGGVDTGKFAGALHTVNIETDSSNIGRSGVIIAMDNVYTTISGSRITFANSTFEVILDSGTSGIYLPNDIVVTLGTLLNATYDDGLQVLIQPCTAVKNDSSLGMTFSGAEINIPVAQLATPVNTTHCALLISKADSDGPFLGLAFLRSAYLVFDYDHNSVSFQQTVYNNASNITAISVNGVQGLQSSLTTTTPSSNSPSTTSASTSSAAGSKSSAKNIGIGVGVGLGVPLILLLVGGLLFLRRRKRRSTENVDRSTPDNAQIVPQTVQNTTELPSTTTYNAEQAPSYQEKLHEDRYSNATTELPGSPPQHYGSPVTAGFSGSNFKEGPLSEYYESETTATARHSQ